MPTAAMQVPAGLFAGVILKAGVPRSGRSTPFRINARAPLISANTGGNRSQPPAGFVLSRGDDLRPWRAVEIGDERCRHPGNGAVHRELHAGPVRGLALKGAGIGFAATDL